MWLSLGLRTCLAQAKLSSAIAAALYSYFFSIPLDSYTPPQNRARILRSAKLGLRLVMLLEEMKNLSPLHLYSYGHVVKGSC